MKALVVTLALLFWPIPRSPEIRTIGFKIEGTNAGPNVSIYSETKKENRHRVSIDEAKSVLASAEWRGSTVFVGIVVSHDVSIHAYRPLLDAFDRHPMLELLFIRNDGPPQFIHDNTMRMIRGTTDR